MPNRKARILLPLALVLAASVPAICASSPPVPAAPDEHLLETLMGQFARLPERRANFQERKTLGVLDETLRSNGWLFYRRPGHLEKITLAPRPESLIVDGEWLSLTGADGTSHVVDLGNQPELGALIDTLRAPLAGDLATLRQLYRVTAEGSMAGWRLTLVPTDKRIARFLRQSTIDGAGTELRAIRIVEANGDEQVMTIEAAP